MREESTTLTVKLEKLASIESLKSQWEELEKDASVSIFLSWAWIGSWLPSVMPHCEPMVLSVHAGDRLIGLSVLTAGQVLRRKLIRSKVLYLNETGIEDFDRLTIEHNGLLCAAGYEESLLKPVLDYLVRCNIKWDELQLAGTIQAVENMEKISRSVGLGLKLVSQSNYYYINLSSIREHEENYLDKLSSNTRYQIRRSLREYEKIGELQLRKAQDVTEALVFFDAMRELHQAYWQKKGAPGAFCSDFLIDFHKNFISARFMHGNVQLLRITAGDSVVGYLYNFVFDGHVYCYQSGFNYLKQSKYKPGLVSHYLSIQHNFEVANNLYDFLAGDSQYKNSLSTESAPMSWVMFQKPRFMFTIEDVMLSIKNKLNSS